MLEIIVVSPRADALAEVLVGRLPDDVAPRFFHSTAELDDRALAAEVALGAPDALVPVLHSMPNLAWVQSTWAGVTPFLEFERRDYLLTGVKGIFGASMSEYVLGWALALERSIIRHAAARSWDSRPDRGLGALTLGIAGVGSIGEEVALRSAPFFAEVRGLNSDGRSVAGCARCYASADRLAFADGLDVLAMLLPHTSGTDGLVDAALIAAMRRGAIIINAGRANALDLSAALAALETGDLQALVLDVLEQEPLAEGDSLWDTPGLYLTSHTAAPTGMQAIVGVFLDNLARYRAGQPLQGLIDFDRGY